MAVGIEYVGPPKAQQIVMLPGGMARVYFLDGSFQDVTLVDRPPMSERFQQWWVRNPAKATALLAAFVSLVPPSLGELIRALL